MNITRVDQLQVGDVLVFTFKEEAILSIKKSKIGQALVITTPTKKLRYAPDTLVRILD